MQYVLWVQGKTTTLHSFKTKKNKLVIKWKRKTANSFAPFYTVQ